MVSSVLNHDTLYPVSLFKLREVNPRSDLSFWSAKDFVDVLVLLESSQLHPAAHSSHHLSSLDLMALFRTGRVLILFSVLLEVTRTASVRAFPAVSLRPRASNPDPMMASRHAAELADDATSASRRHLLYPGTKIPLEVMNYLVEERHGVDHHILMKFRFGMGATVKSKIAEMLHDERTFVSSFSYYGKTYFIVPASSYPDSAFPTWDHLLSHPDLRLPADVIQPFLVTNVERVPGTSGAAARNFDFSVLCVRTTTSKDDKTQLIQSFQERRNYLTTIKQMLRRMP